jgi:hypothetical protein
MVVYGAQINRIYGSSFFAVAIETPIPEVSRVVNRPIFQIYSQPHKNTGIQAKLPVDLTTGFLLNVGFNRAVVIELCEEHFGEIQIQFSHYSILPIGSLPLSLYSHVSASL